MNCTTSIIINPYCHEGMGWERWKRIRSSIKKLFPDACSLVLEKGVRLSTFLDHQLAHGDNFLISAGGDGSVHHLINALVKDHAYQLSNVRIGAIGLGSSNDFIKPVLTSQGGIPLRVDTDNMICHDIGKLEFRNGDGEDQTEYFIINTSMGVTAFGNYIFNHPGPWLAFLKKYSTPLAIIHTALASLFLSENNKCRVEFDNMVIEEDLTNLNILKLPYVSGNFRYSQNIAPNDGKISLNLCHSMGVLRKLQALYKLANGRLSPGKHMITARTDNVKISSDKAFLFECDGETFTSDQINISVIPKAIKVAQN